MSGQTKIRTAAIRNTLLAGVAAVALSAAAPNASQAQDGSFYGYVEGRYLMSFGDETDVGIGQLACSIFDIYADCELDFAQSETDDGVGGKVKLGYRSSGAWDLAIAGSGGRLDGDREFAYASLVYAGGGPFPDQSGEVVGDVESETQYAVADFEVGYNIGIGNNGGNVRLFAGARYARFDQDVFFDGALSANAAFIFPVITEPFYTAPFSAEREVEFEGVGPRIGVGLNLPLGNRVSIAAEVSGSVLFGDRDTNDSFTAYMVDVLPFPLSYSASDSEDEIIPNAEGNVGLSFVIAGGHPGPVAEITLGYHAEAWFDINNTRWDVGGPAYPVLIDPSFPGVDEEDGDQYIHGPFVRIGIRR
jgi:hypothetical protein